MLSPSLSSYPIPPPTPPGCAPTSDTPHKLQAMEHKVCVGVNAAGGGDGDGGWSTKVEVADPALPSLPPSPLFYRQV